MSRSELIVEEGIVAGNAYDKYGTRNPIARKMMDNFLATFDALVERAHEDGVDEVHEVGCGEGHLCVRLHQAGFRVRGSDFSQQVIAVARETIAERPIQLNIKSAYDLAPPADAAPLVVCCEVLEHLDEPECALEVLSRIARPHLIVSVPREPIWRALNMARGKYVRHGGNTPGHLNHWSTSSFLAFLKSKVDVVEVRKPFPWTMVLCRARAAS